MKWLEFLHTIQLNGGVLSSSSNNDARYPSRQAVDELIDTAGKNNLKLSLHLCGKNSRNFQTFDFNLFNNLLAPYSRIQVNGKIEDIEILESHMNVLRRDVIIQVAEFNKDINLKQLFDLSGGRGIVPDKFPDHPGYMVGYAGGIKSYNVMDIIDQINDERFWIDMETSVRSNGWFDLDEVRYICEKVYIDKD